MKIRDRRRNGQRGQRVQRRPKGPIALHSLSALLRYRLDNWGNVMRNRERDGISPTYVICERMARQKGQIDAARRPIYTDEADASLVEAAWRARTMTILSKELLRGYYVLRLHPAHLARLLSLGRVEFDSRLYHAHIQIEFVLALVDRLAQNRAQIADTPPLASLHSLPQVPLPDGITPTQAALAPAPAAPIRAEGSRPVLRVA
jgi:hypothetical protein